MPTFFPPTKGLLVSMACRHSHDFYVEKESLHGLPMGFTDAEREALLAQMHDLYVKLTTPHAVPESVTERQIFEEIDGTGFYCPEREPDYAGRWPKGYQPRFTLAELPQPG